VPFLPPRVLPARWCKGAHLPLAMLRAGHAVVYEQAGAEYGALGKDAYVAAELQAKCVLRLPTLSPHIVVRFARVSTRMGADGCLWDTRKAKRGIWRVASESPAEYKRRLRSGDVTPAAVATPAEDGRGKAAASDAETKGKARRSVWARLFRK
jgi:hypothetical protein